MRVGRRETTEKRPGDVSTVVTGASEPELCFAMIATLREFPTMLHRSRTDTGERHVTSASSYVTGRLSRSFRRACLASSYYIQGVTKLFTNNLRKLHQAIVFETSTRRYIHSRKLYVSVVYSSIFKAHTHFILPFQSPRNFASTSIRLLPTCSVQCPPFH